MWYNIRTHRHYTITHIMRCTHIRSVQEAIRQVPKRGPAQLCLKHTDIVSCSARQGAPLKIQCIPTYSTFRNMRRNLCFTLPLYHNINTE